MQEGSLEGFNAFKLVIVYIYYFYINQILTENVLYMGLI
jgi:hypothetical protein